MSIKKDFCHRADWVFWGKSRLKQGISLIRHQEARRVRPRAEVEGHADIPNGGELNPGTVLVLPNLRSRRGTLWAVRVYNISSSTSGIIQDRPGVRGVMFQGRVVSRV